MGFAQDTGGGGFSGMLLNPAVRDMYDYYKLTQHGCELRFYPEVGADGTPLPIRTGPNIQDVTNWVNGAHFGLVMKGGNDPAKEKITLLLTIDGDEALVDRKQRRGMRCWERVRRTFHHAIDTGTAPSHWMPWAKNTLDATMGPSGKTTAKPMLFARGMMTGYATRKGAMRSISRQTPKFRCIFFLSPAAQSSLQELVMQRDPNSLNYHGDDFDKMFVNNSSLVDPVRGRLIQFGRLGQPGGSPATGEVTFGATGVDSGKPDDNQFKIPAAIVEDGNPVAIPPEYIQAAWEHPWSNLLQTWPDEKALIAALETGIPDELLIEAFRSDLELLSERLIAKMKKIDSAGATAQPVAMPQTAATQTAAPVSPAVSDNVSFPVVKPKTEEPAADATIAPTQPDGTGVNSLDEMDAALKAAQDAANAAK